MTGQLSLWQMLFDSMGQSLLIALLPAYLFTLIKGDKTDRRCAHVLAIGALLDMMLAVHQQASGEPWQYRGDQMIIDLLLLATQTVIATRSSRRYPIIIAAAQLIIVLTELLNSGGLIEEEKTLSVLIGFAAALQLGAFIGGLVAHYTQYRKGAAATTFAH